MIFSKAAPASVLAIAVFYVVLQGWLLPPDGFFSGDQGPKYLQATAFAEQGLFSPDIHVLSRDLDVNLEFQDPILHKRGTQLVSAFSWLLPMLTAPFLRLLGLRGLYVIPAVSVIVIFLAARDLGRHLGLGTGLASAWTAVAATPVLFFGAEHWEHAPAAACAIVAADWLVPVGDRERPAAGVRLVAAGAVAAVGALFREEAGLALPALLLARAWAMRGDGRGRANVRATAHAALGAALVVIATIPVNLAIYGTTLPLHLSSEIEKSNAYLATRMDVVRDMLLPSPGGALFAVVAIAIAIAAAWSRGRTASTRMALAHASVLALFIAIAAVPAWRLATGTLPPFQGFTMSSAAHTWVFAFALVYLAFLPAGREVSGEGARYLLGAAVLLAAATIAIVPSSGGAQWSPRYLLAVAPLLAVVAPAGLWAASRRGRPSGDLFTAERHVRAAVCLVLAAALVVQCEGILALARTKRITAAVVAQTSQLTSPGDVIVSAVPWFPEINATLLGSRRILFAPAEAPLEEIARRASARGIRSLWLVASPTESTLIPPAFIAASRGGGASCRFVRRDPARAMGRGLELIRYACGP